MRLLPTLLTAGACLGALLAVASLGGCGQKGPLYLPDKKLEELQQKREQRKQVKTGMLPLSGHPATA